MSKAIIFSNGNISNTTRVRDYISPHDFIICADGGIKHALKYKLLPQVVTGDGDSLTPTHKKSI